MQIKLPSRAKVGRACVPAHEAFLVDESGQSVYFECNAVAAGVDEIVFDNPNGSEVFETEPASGAAVRAEPPPFLDEVLAFVAGENVEMRIEFLSGVRMGLHLTGTDHLKGWHRPRTSNLMRTSYHAVDHCQWWITITAGSPRVDFILNLHNGCLPPHGGVDDFIRSIELGLPSGWGLQWSGTDPAVDIGKNELLRSDVGPYGLPVRWERPFRFHIAPDQSVADPLNEIGHVRWPHGFLAQGVAAPALDPALEEGITKGFGDELGRLVTMQGTAGGPDPESPLWPAAGQKYGGPTGSQIHVLEGIQGAAGIETSSLVGWLRILQLRWRARHPGCIYEEDGSPINADDYVDAEGEAPWRMFNRVFQSSGGVVLDEPFGFSNEDPDPEGRWKTPGIVDPRSWQPVDHQHEQLVNGINHALVYLENCPLARQYTLMDAELGRMALWEGPGRAQRYRPPSGPAGLGSAHGRGDAWVANAMVHAAAIEPGVKERYRNWFDTLVANLRHAQMPNGLTQAQVGVKMSKVFPFNDQFFVAQSDEAVFLINALRGIYQVCAFREVPELIVGMFRGLWTHAWIAGNTGCWQFIPVGPNDGSGRRYQSQGDIPSGTLKDMEGNIIKQAHRVASAAAYALEAGGAPLLVGGLLRMWAQAPDLPTVLSKMESWGRAAGNAQQRSPIENWGHNMALLQEKYGAS